MLDYTIAAGKRVWRNIRLTSIVFNIAVQAISIFFLTYILLKGNGIFAINLLLLALSCGYLGFYCLALANGMKGKLKRRVKQIFSWSKRAIKLVNLGIMLYAIFSAKDRTTMDVVIAVCSLGFWVLDLLFELLSMAVRSWGTLVFEGLKADAEKLATPVTATKNFFKKLTGQEVEEKPEPTKKRIFLDGLVEERRTEKVNEKLEKKLLKKQKRAEAREAKLAQRQAKKEIAPTEDK